MSYEINWEIQALDQVWRDMPVRGRAIRVSLGLVSNLDDVERFLTFVQTTYRDRRADASDLSPRQGC